MMSSCTRNGRMDVHYLYFGRVDVFIIVDPLFCTLECNDDNDKTI